MGGSVLLLRNRGKTWTGMTWDYAASRSSPQVMQFVDGVGTLGRNRG